MTLQSTRSELLYLDTFSRQTPPFACANLVVLQVALAGFCCGRELVVSRALDNVYPDLVASDPLSVSIELKSDIGGIKLPVADALPGTMPATVYRVRIPASKESNIDGVRATFLRCERPASEKILH